MSQEEHERQQTGRVLKNTDNLVAEISLPLNMRTHRELVGKMALALMLLPHVVRMSLGHNLEAARTCLRHAQDEFALSRFCHSNPMSCSQHTHKTL